MGLESRLRSAITLGVLTILLLLALVYGWTALTKPFPSLTSHAHATGPCSNRVFAAGSKVHTDEVTVSVYNAGTTAGQASKTLEALVTRGFGAGDTGNAPSGTKVRTAEVWAPDPHSPAVVLVASQFQQAKVVRHASLGAGVTVVVGNSPGALAKGLTLTAAKTSVTICSPTS